MRRIATTAGTLSKHVCANALIVVRSTHVNVVYLMLQLAANCNLGRKYRKPIKGGKFKPKHNVIQKGAVRQLLDMDDRRCPG